jgi:hypothetical protein
VPATGTTLAKPISIPISGGWDRHEGIAQRRDAALEQARQESPRTTATVASRVRSKRPNSSTVPGGAPRVRVSV